MIEYFDEETLCHSCGKNNKRENQLVCDGCHDKELQPEPL